MLVVDDVDAVDKGHETWNYSQPASNIHMFSKYGQASPGVAAKLDQSADRGATRIPWLPGSVSGWKCRSRDYHAETDGAREFQRWLKAENAVGNISFQEEVSMLPAVLAEVEPGHAVLDMLG